MELESPSCSGMWSLPVMLLAINRGPEPCQSAVVQHSPSVQVRVVSQIDGHGAVQSRGARPLRGVWLETT